MRFLLPSLFALFLVLPLFAAPVPADAALVTCGGSAQSPCTLCDLVKGVATITDYIRDIMVFAALAIIVAMGILYIVSAGNPGMMETAKKGVFASLAGLVIILAAWIIVNTVMFVVFDAKSDLGVGASFSVSGGFEFDCGASVSAASAAPSASSVTTTPPSGGTVSVPAGGTVSFASSTLVTFPADGIITYPDGNVQNVSAGGTNHVIEGAILSFPSVSAPVTITLPNGGQSTVSAPSAGGSSSTVSKPGPCTIATSPAAPTVGGGVTLTASCSGGTPTAYAWTGNCIANSNKCVENGLTLGNHTYSVTASNAAGNATASKILAVAATAVTTYPLSVSKTGSGTVTGTGISCGADCAESYAIGTNVALTASPAAGNVFASWSGACAGNAPTCTVTMSEAWTVFANFIPAPSGGTYLLSVSKDGTGTGTVTGPGINCGADCSETYTGNPTVSLMAIPGANSEFDGWFGACSGTGACSIPMTSAKSVTASFKPKAAAGGGGSGGGGGGLGTFTINPSTIKNIPSPAGFYYETFDFILTGGTPNAEWFVNGTSMGLLDAAGYGKSNRYYPSGCGAGALPSAFPLIFTFMATVNGTDINSATLTCTTP